MGYSQVAIEPILKQLVQDVRQAWGISEDRVFVGPQIVEPVGVEFPYAMIRLLPVQTEPDALLSVEQVFQFQIGLCEKWDTSVELALAKTRKANDLIQVLMSYGPNYATAYLPQVVDVDYAESAGDDSTSYYVAVLFECRVSVSAIDPDDHDSEE